MEVKGLMYSFNNKLFGCYLTIVRVNYKSRQIQHAQDNGTATSWFQEQ